MLNVCLVCLRAIPQTTAITTASRVVASTASRSLRTPQQVQAAAVTHHAPPQPTTPAARPNRKTDIPPALLRPSAITGASRRAPASAARQPQRQRLLSHHLLVLPPWSRPVRSLSLMPTTMLAREKAVVTTTTKEEIMVRFYSLLYLDPFCSNAEPECGCSITL